MTEDVWKILQVLAHMDKYKSRVTVSGLTDLVRGAGGGGFTAGKKGKKAQDKVDLDLDAVCEGKVSRSKIVRRRSLNRYHVSRILELEGYRDADYPSARDRTPRRGSYSAPTRSMP